MLQSLSDISGCTTLYLQRMWSLAKRRFNINPQSSTVALNLCPPIPATHLKTLLLVRCDLAPSIWALAIIKSPISTASLPAYLFLYIYNPSFIINFLHGIVFCKSTGFAKSLSLRTGAFTKPPKPKLALVQQSMWRCQPTLLSVGMWIYYMIHHVSIEILCTQIYF